MLTNGLLGPRDELFDVSERTARDGALAKDAKPTFDLIEPRSVSRRALDVDSRPRREPISNFDVFVSGVIVRHAIDVSASQRQGRLVDAVQVD